MGQRPTGTDLRNGIFDGLRQRRHLQRFRPRDIAAAIGTPTMAFSARPALLLGAATAPATGSRPKRPCPAPALSPAGWHHERPPPYAHILGQTWSKPCSARADRGRSARALILALCARATRSHQGLLLQPDGCVFEPGPDRRPSEAITAALERANGDASMLPAHVRRGRDHRGAP